MSKWVLIALLTVAIECHGTRLAGRYELLSVFNRTTLSFCSESMQITGDNEMELNASDIKFDDEQVCDGGVLKFGEIANKQQLTNDSISSGVILVSINDVLMCANNRVGAMVLNPSKPIEFLQFVFPPNRRYFILFGRDQGECYYAQSKSELLKPAISTSPPSTKPTQDKQYSTKSTSGTSTNNVKSKHHSIWRWLAPLLAIIALLTLSLCVCCYRKHRALQQIKHPRTTMPTPATSRQLAAISPILRRIPQPSPPPPLLQHAATPRSSSGSSALRPIDVCNV